MPQQEGDGGCLLYVILEKGAQNVVWNSQEKLCVQDIQCIFVVFYNATAISITWETAWWYLWASIVPCSPPFSSRQPRYYCILSLCRWCWSEQSQKKKFSLTPVFVVQLYFLHTSHSASLPNTTTLYCIQQQCIRLVGRNLLSPVTNFSRKRGKKEALFSQCNTFYTCMYVHILYAWIFLLSWEWRRKLLPSECISFFTSSYSAKEQICFAAAEKRKECVLRSI